MSAYYILQDEQHPLSDINKFLDEIMRTQIVFPQSKLPPTPAHLKSSVTPMFTIAEESPEQEVFDLSPCDKFQASFKTFEQHLDKKIYGAHQRYYEDYKSLCLYLAFLIKQDGEKSQFKKINDLQTKIESARFIESKNAISDAFLGWQEGFKAVTSTKKSSDPISVDTTVSFEDSPEKTKIIHLMLQCYLYHLALERVYFNCLGSGNDIIAEKLFSQGLFLYGLMLIGAFEISSPLQENILKILCLKKTPLAYNNQFRLKGLENYHDYSYTRPIRAQTQAWNLTRLFLGRLRRLILCINAFAVSELLQNSIFFLDPFLQNFLGMINLVYFIPRLISFIAPWIKHLINYPGMSEEEKILDFNTRFWGQFHRRWEAIFRDILWFANGFSGIFIFVGAWGGMSLYFGAAMQLLEVLLNVYLYRNCKYRHEKNLEFFGQNRICDDKTKHELYNMDLRMRFWLEIENCERRMYNSGLILLSNLLILPFFGGISLYIPLCGAVLAIVMTGIQFFYAPSWTAKLEVPPPAFPFIKSFDATPIQKQQPGSTVSNQSLHNTGA